MGNSRLAPSGADASLMAVSTVATLFREHHGELVRLALLLVGDLATAEDVVQDVYMGVRQRWSKAAASRAGPGSCPGRRNRMRRWPEIAAVLGVSPGTVKSTAARALAATPSRPQTRRRARARHQAPWRAWLVPAAAAASVALIIGLAVAVTSGPSKPGTDRRAVPGSRRRPSRLSITGSGPAMPLTRIKGGDFTVASTPWFSLGSLAVSPDGSKLTLTLDNDKQRGQDSQGWADKIVVIDVPGRDTCGAVACTGRARPSRSRTFRGPRTAGRWSSSGYGAVT